MLEQVASIAKLATLAQKLQNKEFNATLPILLKVLAQKNNGKYLLQLGNTTIETKSQKDLLLGQRYWANMSKSSAGAIILSKLLRQPKMLDMLEKSPLKFDLLDLKEIFKKPQKEAIETYKDFLLDKLVNAQTRYEFLNLGNLLLSLHKEVISFVIDDSSQQGLVQIKRFKLKKQSLEFYAIYPNLGPIKGRVYLVENGVNAEIAVVYESVERILEANKDKLKGFASVKIYQEENIEPLFEFEESLLDIKG